MKPNELTIKIAREKLDKKQLTSLELTKSCLARIKAVDKKLHACLAVYEKEALVQAKAADKRLAQGEKGGLLGIPYLVKDNILTKGLKTTAASKMLENYIAPYDATVIVKLKKAGAVLLGKTNLDEFAHGASTENSAFGPTKNPWDLKRVPGGSSGGSAAAVATDMCLFALGSDTGGSIRQPASFCGLAGLKPSYGRVSRHGLIAMTSSTDVIGPLTKTAEDAALVLQVIAGGDNQDATVSQAKVPAYQKVFKKNIKGLKIGLPAEYFDKSLNSEIREAVMKAAKDLEGQGAKLVNINLPHTKYGVSVYYIITPAEVSSNLARLDGLRYGFSAKKSKNLLDIYQKNRGEGFGPEAKRRIMLGTYALSAGYYDAYYKKAEAVRLMIKKEFSAAFKKVDVILTPTSPHPAFKLGEQINDPLQMYLEDIFVTGASLAGLPALSLPAGLVNGLPVGLQLIAEKFNEEILFQVGVNYQKDKNILKPNFK
jgi:aspartyl-tRNA(Asn)/glutamyl-tRNA(Gln) amidotransferase subunit A